MLNQKVIGYMTVKVKVMEAKKKHFPLAFFKTTDLSKSKTNDIPKRLSLTSVTSQIALIHDYIKN